MLSAFWLILFTYDCSFCSSIFCIYKCFLCTSFLATRILVPFQIGDLSIYYQIFKSHPVIVMLLTAVSYCEQGFRLFQIWNIVTVNLVTWPFHVVSVMYLRKESRTEYFWCRSSHGLGLEDYIENIPLCRQLYLPLLSHVWQVIH